MSRVKYLVNIFIVVAMLAAVAIARDGRLFGVDFIEEVGEVERINSEGFRVINSSSLAADIVGYGGKTPVEVYVRDGVIERVEVLKNSETPSYFRRIEESGFLESWRGMTLGEAAVAAVDGLSGATLSSEAVAANVRRAAAYGANVEAMSRGGFVVDFKGIVGVLVILCGVVLTLVRVRDAKLKKRLEAVQMVLNVAVLGLWCGSFLSMSQFVSWVSSGVNLSVSVVAVLLLVVTVVMPLVGKKGSYCHLHCPLGAAQVLMGRVPFTKIKIKGRLAKFLGNMRYYILMALLFIMWLGFGFELIDYELFSVFVFESASGVVLILGGVFLVLSLFITRPYCRFVCPTGALITVSQKIK